MKDSTHIFLTNAAQLPWLKNAGTTTVLPGAERIEDEVTASTLLLAQEWDNFRLMLKNRHTRILNVEHYSRFIQWNQIAEEARDAIARNVEQAVAKALNEKTIENGALRCLTWDILICAMEVEYEDVLPVRFCLDRLWPLYRAGHIPCGWSGSPIDEAWAISTRPLPAGQILYY